MEEPPNESLFRRSCEWQGGRSSTLLSVVKLSNREPEAQTL